MEERGREATIPVNTEPAPSETLVEGSRRRASAPKRKGPSGSLSSSSSSAKRLVKERSHLPFAPYIHNGPVTRARQSPNKFAPVPSAASPQMPTEQQDTSDTTRAAGRKESEGAGELAGESAALELVDMPVVDAEFDAVRSRDSNVHVVPTHAGWFSWEKIHPLEERTMVSFFNGKSEKRTPNLYKNIRNLIMEKFHHDPQSEIEVKHLSEIEAGDIYARQEVMEFLDYWGLINFHPFPPSSSTSALDTERTAKTPALTEKLYQFEEVNAAPRLTPKAVDMSVPPMPPRLFPETAITDDFVRPEGPSVEYHCNSCSGDCSRKRYHCQTQADFDLCTECYNDRKFDSGMTPADFILMESAEVPRIGGGSWTDQETLLLLEALELYGENWNEIAEHVATKTKAQCMLHFIKMPIEDTFLEDDDRRNEDVLEENNIIERSKEAEASDAPVKVDSKDKENEGLHDSFSENISKGKDKSKMDPVQGTSTSSIVINALKSAFEMAGSLPEEDELLSFSESGNPVMALAAFFFTLVDHDLALTSSRSSLKAIFEDSPGIQLATRHCFILEGPPENEKGQQVSDSQGAQKEETNGPVVNGNGDTQDTADQNDKFEVVTESIPSASFEEHTNGHDPSKSAGSYVSNKDVAHVKGSHKMSLPNEKHAGSNDNSLHDLGRNIEDALDCAKGSKELHVDEDTPCTGQEGKEKAIPLMREVQSAFSGKQQHTVGVSADGISPAEAIKESSPAVSSADGKEHVNIMDSNATAGIREQTGEDNSRSTLGSDEVNCKTFVSEDDGNINKIKRAAVTALSAAAVKARLLANQEEDQICQLVSLIIEKQLQKLEIKLALSGEIDTWILRVREQVEMARQRLMHERAQIIAARLGLPASSSRSIPSSLPVTKFATNHVFSGPRPLGFAFQKSISKRQ